MENYIPKQILWFFFLFLITVVIASLVMHIYKFPPHPKSIEKFHQRIEHHLTQ